MHIGRYFYYLVMGGGALGTAAALMSPQPPTSPELAKTPIETIDVKTDFKQATAPITIERIDEMLALLKTPQAHEHPAIKVAAEKLKDVTLAPGEKNSLLDKVTYTNNTIGIIGKRTDKFTADTETQIKTFQKAMEDLPVTGQLDARTRSTYGQADNIMKARFGLIAMKTEMIFKKTFKEKTPSAQEILTLAGVESTFNPNAGSPDEAFGIMQMTKGAFKDMMMKHGHRFGQAELVAALKKDPDNKELHEKMYALRADPEIAIPMGTAYYAENGGYVVYFLGPRAAKDLMTMAKKPDPKTADIKEYRAAHKKNKKSPLIYDNPSDPERWSKQAKNNESIFFKEKNEKTGLWEKPLTSEKVLEKVDTIFKTSPHIATADAIGTLVQNLLTNQAPAMRIPLADGRVAAVSVAGKSLEKRL